MIFDLVFFKAKKQQQQQHTTISCRILICSYSKQFQNEKLNNK